MTKTEKIEQLIEKIINDMGERPFARTWETEVRNMRKILKKHLQSLQEPTEERELQEEREDICLRCGVERKEVKREGSNGCHSRGFHYPKHLWK